MLYWLETRYAKHAAKHPEKYLKYTTVRETCKEILLGWSFRLRNIHSKLPVLVRLSFLLLFHQYPYPIWNILSHLRLALSVNTTKRLCAKATTIPISIRNAWEHHNTIAVVGIDNMSYIMYNAQVRIKDGTMNRYPNII
jgi:hypothetical protein